MRARWIGDGHAESVTMGPYNLGGVPGQPAISLPAIVFPAGKAVEVPDAFVGVLTGNHLFEVERPKGDEVADAKAEAIRAAEEDVARAQNDLDTAKKEEKKDAQERLDAARTHLDAVKDGKP